MTRRDDMVAFVRYLSFSRAAAPWPVFGKERLHATDAEMPTGVQMA